MKVHNVLVLPKVKAPELDEAFLPLPQWRMLPAVPLVRAVDGEPAGLPTDVHLAWSVRGIHVCFCCNAPSPLDHDFQRDLPIEEEESVGIFLDPQGERSQYIAILASPYGRVADARIENHLHHEIGSEFDRSWHCTGVRVRSWSRQHLWTVELLIPFTGLTPALDPPKSGDRWTGNLYRIERQPLAEIYAWQPVYHTPVDLHDTEHFGIFEFGE